MHPDVSLENFKKIKQRAESTENINEATTRCLFIDDVLEQVLGFSKDSDICCEYFIKSPEGKKWADYILKINGVSRIFLEAKSLGVSFDFDFLQKNRTYSLDGVISKNEALNSAIEQVRDYCSNEGIEIAIVSNGLQYILFEPITKGSPWKKGNAVVFHSLEDIEKNFNQFMQVFSKEGINASGYLSVISSEGNSFSKKLIDNVQTKKGIIRKNNIGNALKDILDKVFGDLTDKSDDNLFKECYVYESRTNQYNTDIESLLKDRVPRWDNTDISEIKQNKQDVPNIEKKIISVKVEKGKSEIIYLIGDVGVGKTHFIYRFFNILDNELVKKSYHPININFLKGGPIEDQDSNAIKLFINTTIINNLEERGDWNLFQWETTKKIYRKNVDLLTKGDLAPYAKDEEKFEQMLSEKLQAFKKDFDSYVPQLFSYIGANFHKKMCLIIDNVDQYSFEFQKMIYNIAQQLAYNYDCIIVISLRGENYWKSLQEDVVNIKPNRNVYQISKPSFQQVFSKRIKYSEKIIKESPQTREEIDFDDGMKLKIDDAQLNFLKGIADAILNDNYLSSAIESLSNGNIRASLDFIASIISSGHLRSSDVMNLIKSIKINPKRLLNAGMYGDYQYYVEDSTNPIANILTCGNKQPTSHFIGVRILRLLDLSRSTNSTVGIGFISKEDIYQNLNAFGYDKSSIDKFLQKFLQKRLIESENKIKKDINNCSFLKITSSGYFHLHELLKEPFYLANIALDTFIYNKNEYDKLFESVDVQSFDVAKSHKLISAFIEYLEQEEQREIKTSSLANVEPYLYNSILASLKKRFIDNTQILLVGFKDNVDDEKVRAYIKKLLGDIDLISSIGAIKIIRDKYKETKLVFVHLKETSYKDKISTALSNFTMEGMSIRSFPVYKIF